MTLSMKNDKKDKSKGGNQFKTFLGLVKAPLLLLFEWMAHDACIVSSKSLSTSRSMSLLSKLV